MNVNNRTGIPDLEREIHQLRKNNAELMEIGDARETAMRVFGADNDALRRQVTELQASLELAWLQNGNAKLIELENYRMRAVLIKLTNHQKYQILNIHQVQEMAEAALSKLANTHPIPDALS